MPPKRCSARAPSARACSGAARAPSLGLPLKSLTDHVGEKYPTIDFRVCAGTAGPGPLPASGLQAGRRSDAAPTSRRRVVTPCDAAQFLSAARFGLQSAVLGCERDQVGLPGASRGATRLDGKAAEQEGPAKALLTTDRCLRSASAVTDAQNGHVSAEDLIADEVGIDDGELTQIVADRPPPMRKIYEAVASSQQGVYQVACRAWIMIGDVIVNGDDILKGRG